MTPPTTTMICFLRGLFERTITNVEDDDLGDRTRARPERLGGDPDAVFYLADT
jgi:hypothetical protein